MEDNPSCGQVVASWWISGEGDNLLKGVVGDTDNPPRLKDEMILDFLRRIPAARDSFNELYPSLTTDEQARMDKLAVSATFAMPDLTAETDNFMSRLTAGPIRTAGPRGGRRIGR